MKNLLLRHAELKILQCSDLVIVPTLQGKQTIKQTKPTNFGVLLVCFQSRPNSAVAIGMSDPGQHIHVGSNLTSAAGQCFYAF